MMREICPKCGAELKNVRGNTDDVIETVYFECGSTMDVWCGVPISLENYENWSFSS